MSIFWLSYGQESNFICIQERKDHRFSDINLPRDGGGDEGGALLLEPLDQFPLLAHQLVDPPRLAVEIDGNSGLFCRRWEWRRGV